MHYPYQIELDERPDFDFCAFHDQDETILPLSEDSDEDGVPFEELSINNEF